MQKIFRFISVCLVSACCCAAQSLPHKKDTGLQQLVNYQAEVKRADSLLNERNVQRINALQVKYEAARKDQEIAARNERIALLLHQQQLRDAAISRGRIGWMGVATGVLLLLSLCGLLYSRYRAKQRSIAAQAARQQELDAQQALLNELREEQYHLLGEREWLEAEMQHRVKDNLKMMIGLMGTGEGEGTPAYQAIRDGRLRMQAMSLLYEQLCESGSGTVIDMPAYLQALAKGLRESYGVPARIEIQVNALPGHLSVPQAMPVGLIVNEALTNAVKYAFPASASGSVQVSLTREEQQLRLVIADNGQGFVPGFDPDAHRSFGLQLIATLTGQLDGALEIDGGKGVSIQVTFAHKAAEPVHAPPPVSMR